VPVAVRSGASSTGKPKIKKPRPEGEAVVGAEGAAREPSEDQSSS
jgi:hypothetical protein